MRPRSSPSHPSPTASGRSPSVLFPLTLLLWIACCTPPLHAQNAPDNAAPFTLHLYARLVEIPTLILPRNHEKLPLLDPQQITIKLDTEQPFHPASIRIEGNDPLSIAILLDVSGDQSDLLSAFQKDFSAWVSSSLRPQDHVSIFALDCDLLQTSNNLPADPSRLQAGLDLALTSPLTHGTSNKPACGKSIRLRGSIVVVMQKLSRLPGRRILLLVSGGRDGKSNLPWSQLTSEATLDSTTIFGLTSPGFADFESISNLYTLARQSGGLLYSTPLPHLPNALNRIIELLRSRYILQFPLPPQMSAAEYHVFVSVPKFDTLILPSGISFPLPNPSEDHPSTDLPDEGPPPDPTPPPITPNP